VHFKNSMPNCFKYDCKIDSSLIGQYYLVDSIWIKDNDTAINLFNNSDFIKHRDSSDIFDIRVIINSKLVLYNMTFGKSYRMDMIDTSMISKKEKFKRKAILDNYVIYEDFQIDTILNLNKKDKIKFWNGKYYLSKRISKHDWEVYQLEYLNDKEYSINLTNDEDAQKLGLDTSEWKPIFNYYVNLSNNQFKEFVDLGGFRTKYKIKKYAR